MLKNKKKLTTLIFSVFLSCLLIAGYLYQKTSIFQQNTFNKVEQTTKLVTSNEIDLEETSNQNDESQFYILPNLDSRYFYKFLRIKNGKYIEIDNKLLYEVLRQVIKKWNIKADKILIHYKNTKESLDLLLKFVKEGKTILQKRYTFLVETS